MPRMCLNLGSGRDYRHSDGENMWLNADKSEAVNPNVIADIDERLPFDDDSFDLILLQHVLEHSKDIIKTMEEVWRVAKPGAEVLVVCPYYTNLWSWGDPTHTHAISEGTFGFFSYPVYEMNAKRGLSMSQLFPKCDFDYKTQKIKSPTSIAEADEYSIKHLWNVIEEIVAEMKVVKPVRMFDLAQYQKRQAVAA